MKTCPFCDEMIQEKAIKCRYCGEFISEFNAVKNNKQSNSKASSSEAIDTKSLVEPPNTYSELSKEQKKVIEKYCIGIKLAGLIFPWYPLLWARAYRTCSFYVLFILLPVYIGSATGYNELAGLALFIRFVFPIVLIWSKWFDKQAYNSSTGNLHSVLLARQNIKLPDERDQLKESHKDKAKKLCLFEKVIGVIMPRYSLLRARQYKLFLLYILWPVCWDIAIWVYSLNGYEPEAIALQILGGGTIIIHIYFVILIRKRLHIRAYNSSKMHSLRIRIANKIFKSGE